MLCNTNPASEASERLLFFFWWMLAGSRTAHVGHMSGLGQAGIGNAQVWGSLVNLVVSRRCLQLTQPCVCAGERLPGKQLCLRAAAEAWRKTWQCQQLNNCTAIRWLSAETSIPFICC